MLKPKHSSDSSCVSIRLHVYMYMYCDITFVQIYCASSVVLLNWATNINNTECFTKCPSRSPCP